MIEEIDKIVGEGEKIPPVNHGYKFTGMYKKNDEENVISLTNTVIESVLFNDDGYFAGFRMKDIETGVYLTLSPLGTTQLHPKHNLQQLMQANDHTRLIGFRTTKRCRTDK